MRRLTLLGMLASSSSLEPAEADEPGDHEVGEIDEVGADVLARVQRVLDLGEALLVVVEVLACTSTLRPVASSNGAHRLLVDVEGPVRDARGVVASAPRRRRLGAVVVVPAAGGENARAEDDGGRSAGRAAAEEAAPAQVGTAPTLGRGAGGRRCRWVRGRSIGQAVGSQPWSDRAPRSMRRRFVRRGGQPSSNISSRSSAVGMSAAGRTSEAAPASSPTPVARAEQGQLDVVAHVGDDRRRRRGPSATGGPPAPGTRGR